MFHLRQFFCTSRQTQPTVFALWFGFVALTTVIPESARAATFTIANGDVAALIAAINSANTNPGADTINLAPHGTYILAVADNPGNGLPIITSQITINGNAATIQRSSAAGTSDFRIIQVTGPNAGDLTLDGAAIRGGKSFGGGGGIYNVNGVVRLHTSSVSNNTDQFFGGGIWNDGNSAILTLANSSIQDNNARLRGGGIYNSAGSVSLINTTISGNTGDSGGGLFNHLGGSTLTLINSTVSGNATSVGAGVTGGGILNVDGTVTLTNSTVTGNSDSNPLGGGIFNYSGITSVKNTIVANNSPANCFGAITTLGHNIASDAYCGLTGSGDLNGTAPLLGPLANNGGPTKTHAPLVGSPAIDAVPLVNCTDFSGAPLTTDQRGISRPQGSACDIGAVEYIPASVPLCSSFGPGNTYSGASGVNVGDGAIYGNAGFSYGMYCTVPASTRLKSIEMGMSTCGGASFCGGSPPRNANSNAVIMSLYDDAGTLLEKISVLGQMQPWTGQVRDIITAPSVLQPLLAAGRTYFLVASEPDPLYDSTVWHFNLPSFNVGSAYFKVGNGPWAISSSNGLAFRINGVIADTTPPTLAGVPSAKIVEATGAGGAVVSFTAPTATDLVDGSVPVNCTPASGARFSIGTTTVNCTATDAASNVGSATFTVAVRDTTPPTFAGFPSNRTAAANGPDGATVTYVRPTATDLVDGSVAVNCTPASGSQFSIGTTTVNCTASDARLNTSTGSFAVTVKSATNQLQDLKVTVTGLGPGTSFADKVQLALEAVQAENIAGACTILNDFVRQVNAQTEKKLTISQATAIKADATRIRAVLSCR